MEITLVSETKAWKFVIADEGISHSILRQRLEEQLTPWAEITIRAPKGILLTIEIDLELCPDFTTFDVETAVRNAVESALPQGA